MFFAVCEDIENLFKQGRNLMDHRVFQGVTGENNLYVCPHCHGQGKFFFQNRAGPQCLYCHGSGRINEEAFQAYGKKKSFSSFRTPCPFHGEVKRHHHLGLYIHPVQCQACRGTRWIVVCEFGRPLMLGVADSDELFQSWYPEGRRLDLPVWPHAS